MEKRQQVRFNNFMQSGKKMRPFNEKMYDNTVFTPVAKTSSPIRMNEEFQEVIDKLVPKINESVALFRKRVKEELVSRY